MDKEPCGRVSDRSLFSSESHVDISGDSHDAASRTIIPPRRGTQIRERKSQIANYPMALSYYSPGPSGPGFPSGGLICEHHYPMQGAPTSTTPGTCFVTTAPRVWLDDFLLTLLPPLRVLSALVVFVHLVRLTRVAGPPRSPSSAQWHLAAVQALCYRNGGPL